MGERQNTKGIDEMITREYYWICAVDRVSGRPVVDGHYNSEHEANQFGFSKNINGGDFSVYKFDTINKFSARDKFKHIMMANTGDISTVFRRAKYPV